MSAGFFLLLIFSVFVTSTSLAEPFIEPYIGLAQVVYEQNVGEFTSSSCPSCPPTAASQLQRAANGFFLGGRIGWSFGKYFFGLEYFQGGPFNNLQENDLTIETKTTNRMIGFVLGGDFKVIRLSVGYFASSFDVNDDETSSFSPSTTTSVTDLSGSAIRVGFGLPISSQKFRANFDFIIHRLDKDVFSSSSSSTPVEFKATTGCVSLSFPFELAR